MNHKQTVKQFTAIDLAKFICSLLVVFIHTTPLVNISEAANFFATNILARVAVPLFFAISGFLFFGKLSYCNEKISGDGDNLRRLLSYCKRNTLLYLGWSVVYLAVIYIPMWHRTGWWDIHVVKDALASLLFSGIHYHLWYLLAMIYAIPLLYAMLRLLSRKKVRWIAAILWVGECLTYSYSWIFPDSFPLVSFLLSRMPIVFDAGFRAVPLLFVGAVIALDPPDWNRKKTYILCTVSFLMCAVEATALHLYSPNTNQYSYLFSTPLLAFSWLFCIVQFGQDLLPEAGARLLRNMSLTIYCFHPLIIEAVDVWGIPGGVLKWLTVTALSAAISAAYAWFQIPNRKNGR